MTGILHYHYACNGKHRYWSNETKHNKSVHTEPRVARLFGIRAVCRDPVIANVMRPQHPMSPKHDPHPDNAVGEFYVECDSCISCEAPYHEAPNLMGRPGSSESNYGCFFRRQPSTPEEIEHACDAVMVSCVEAVRYSGTDRSILQRLYDRGAYSSADVERSDSESRVCDFVKRVYHKAAKHGIQWAYTCQDTKDHAIVACCFGPYRHTLGVFRLDKQTNAIDNVRNDTEFRPTFDHFKRPWKGLWRW